MLKKHDKGNRGVKNDQNFHDVIYGWAFIRMDEIKSNQIKSSFVSTVIKENVKVYIIY
jgi:hypothetical protein